MRTCSSCFHIAKCLSRLPYVGNKKEGDHSNARIKGIVSTTLTYADQIDLLQYPTNRFYANDKLPGPVCFGRYEKLCSVKQQFLFEVSWHRYQCLTDVETLRSRD